MISINKPVQDDPSTSDVVEHAVSADQQSAVAVTGEMQVAKVPSSTARVGLAAASMATILLRCAR